MGFLSDLIGSEKFAAMVLETYVLEQDPSARQVPGYLGLRYRGAAAERDLQIPHTCHIEIRTQALYNPETLNPKPPNLQPCPYAAGDTSWPAQATRQFAFTPLRGSGGTGTRLKAPKSLYRKHLKARSNGLLSVSRSM